MPRTHLITALAVAATAAVPGLAVARTADPISQPAGSAATVKNTVVVVPSPDARDAAQGVSPNSSGNVNLSSPDTRDAVAGRNVDAVVQVPAVRYVTTTDTSGFDWGDAGIGAGGALALVLLITGGGLMYAHHRKAGAGTSGPSALAH